MSLRKTYDSFVSQPAIYRVQTRLLGREKLDAESSAVIEEVVALRPEGVIVDVGGGTAQTRALWPNSWTYISVDPDQRMIEIEDTLQLDRRIGSADSLPIPSGTADVVLLQNMSHHLDDQIWMGALSEANRVLQPDGILIFMDAVLSKKRWISRVFWKLDAGHFPRRSETLQDDISKQFTITQIRRFTLVHHVIVVLATPN